MQYRDKITFLKVNIMTPENQSRGARGEFNARQWLETVFSMHSMPKLLTGQQDQGSQGF
jgi:hypothetical protein